MQSIFDSHIKRSTEIQDFHLECLEKDIGRIKRTCEEEQCSHMTLKLGDIAGLKGFIPPFSMRDLVKVVRMGLERAGVRAHRCHDPHHLNVDWGSALRQSTRRESVKATHVKQKYATADGGTRFIFDGDRGSVPMLDVLMNPRKCKQGYIRKQEAIDITT
jgi:hypothetical protein